MKERYRNLQSKGYSETRILIFAIFLLRFIVNPQKNLDMFCLRLKQ